MDLKLKKLKNGSIRILETKPVLPFFYVSKRFLSMSKAFAIIRFSRHISIR